MSADQFEDNTLNQGIILTPEEYISVANELGASGVPHDPNAKSNPPRKMTRRERLRSRVVDALRQMIEALGEDAGRWS